MIIPKSIAPKLMRLASTPKIYMRESAKSNDMGITEATTKPERRFPKSKTTTKTTIKHPSIRFSAMVKVVFSISSLRSKKALILIPGGKAVEICATLSFTASMTALESASFNIITCPKTFSPSPFPVIAPKRVA